MEDILKLKNKGRIAEGKDADMLFLKNDKIHHVIAMGEFMMKENKILLIVQINGKVRSEVMIQVDEGEENVKEKAFKNNAILKYITGKDIKKVIYIKNRVINIVL